VARDIVERDEKIIQLIKDRLAEAVKIKGEFIGNLIDTKQF
jgi:hypothetical protein